MTLIQKLISIYVAYNTIFSTSQAQAEHTGALSLNYTSYDGMPAVYDPPLMFSRQQSGYRIYTNDFKELYADGNASNVCTWVRNNHNKKSQACLVARVDMADGTARFYSYIDFCKKVSDQHEGDVALPLEFDINKYCRQSQSPASA